MIRYLKLASGHEIIGEEVNDTGSTYTLRKPMVIEMIDHGGHVMCNLVTYCVATDIVEFNGRYVLQTGSASEAFQETYAKLSTRDASPFQDLPEHMPEPLYEEQEDGDGEEAESLLDSVFERLKPTYH